MIINPKERINKLAIEKRAYIDGKYIDINSDHIIEKISPVDGRDLSGLASCQQEDIDHAVQVARGVYQSRAWVDTEPVEKKEVLYRIADLMEENLEELALLDALETGRSLKNYYYDSIPKAIEVVRWFAEAADKYYDHAIPMRAHSFATVTKEALGVVGLITPWNDPMVVAAWKFAPALLMGNSIVIKPAEQSSFSILKVASLTKEAGLPDGVFNVVPGIGEIAGKALALHQGVSGIFFTGSSDVGKLILQYAGKSNMKKVGLECGGKSPFIVSSRCNQLSEAASVLAKNIFYNQGQICSAPSRLIIHKGIKQEFIVLLAEEVKKYVPRDPFSLESEVGCVVSEEQKKRIEWFIEQGKASGATIVDFDYDPENLPSGSYVVPVIFDNVDPGSSIARQEIFGPVLSVIEVNSIGNAVKIANDTDYGLAASIWTDDLDEAYQVSRLLESGIVHINSYGDDDNTVPFGGVKLSGIGRDKSIHAFNEYSTTKTIWTHFKTVLK